MERSRTYRVLQTAKPGNTQIDAHTHSGTDNYNLFARRYPSSQSVPDLVSKVGANGLRFAVNFVAPGSHFYFDFPSMTKSGLLLPLPEEDYPYQVANRQMLYEVDLLGGGNIFPFFTIFPGYNEEAQTEEIERLAGEDRIYGLKLHTMATRTKANSLIDGNFIKLARDHSLPMLIHSRDDNYSDPINAIRLASSSPDVRICISHAAIFNKGVFASAERMSNVFFDVAPFLTLCTIASEKIKRGEGQNLLELQYENPEIALAQLISQFPYKILWGSDEPWTTVTNDATSNVFIRSSYKAEVDVLNSLPPEMRTRISNLNTVKFLFG